MEEASNFEVRNDSDRFILDLVELNKNLKLKPNKLERLKYLQSELSGGKLYVKYCKNQIEKEEKIHEFEKEYPSGPDSPIPPEPKSVKVKSVEVQSFAGKNYNPEYVKPERDNLFCKSMPLNIPRSHFKVFTENNSKNGKPFLTSFQLDSFIRLYID